MSRVKNFLLLELFVTIHVTTKTYKLKQTTVLLQQRDELVV
jgi:hypothetical protein